MKTIFNRVTKLLYVIHVTKLTILWDPEERNFCLKFWKSCENFYGRSCSMNSLFPVVIAIVDVKYENARTMCEIWRKFNNDGGFYDFDRIGLKYKSVVRDYLITRKQRRNYLTKFKFTLVLINTKLRSDFLKRALININHRYSKFAIVLNCCAFSLMQHLTTVFYSKRTWKECFFTGKVFSIASISIDLHELQNWQYITQKLLKGLPGQGLFFALH